MGHVIDLHPTTHRNGRDLDRHDSVADGSFDSSVAALGLHQLEAERPKSPQRSVFAKVSTAHFLMALFGLLGFGLTLFLLQQNEATTTVAVATRDLAPGESLDADAFELREVPLGGPLANAGFSPDDGGTDIGGLSVVAPVLAGAPILDSLVVEDSPLDMLNSFSVPIDDERALGGEFVAGDRVHLIAVIEAKGTGVETFVSTYVAIDVPVLSDREESSGAFGGTLSDYFVAVGLDPEQSLAASSAIQAGELEIVRAGDEPVDPTQAVMSTPGGMMVVDQTDVAETLLVARGER